MKTIKHTLLTFALLLLVVPAQAQEELIFEGTAPTLQEGNNTVYRGQDFSFTVDAKMQQISDSAGVWVISNPQINGQRMQVKNIVIRTKSLDCPDGFEATFVTDATQRYQMGYCEPSRARSSLVHVNGTFGRGTVGVDLNTTELPFIVGYVANKRR